MPKTIIIEGYGLPRKEKIAAAAVTPGHLIERTSADKVQKHSTAGGNAFPMVAVEDDLQGNDIDDAYAAAARVVYVVPQRGDRMYMWLKDGENVSIGDQLESAGNGELQKHTEEDSSGPTVERDHKIVGLADEALDLSSSSGAETTRRIIVEIV